MDYLYLPTLTYHFELLKVTKKLRKGDERALLVSTLRRPYKLFTKPADVSD